MKNKFIYAIFMNIFVVVLNIYLFSDGFLGLRITATNPIVGALLITDIVASLMIIIFGNYKIFVGKEDEYVKEEIDTERLIKQLKVQNKSNKYKQIVSLLVDQIERFERKRLKLNEILTEKFNNDEENKNIFLDVFEEGRTIFYKNIKKQTNIISLFDEEEYLELNKYDLETNKEKQMIFEEDYNEVRELVDSNENILLNIDKLLQETARFGDSVEETKLDKKAINKLEDITSSMKAMRTSE